MIPAISDDLQNDFNYEELPTKTYKLNIQNQAIIGLTNELEAMKQAIFLILNVERYEDLIYSRNYGIELKDLYGKDIFYVKPALKTKITEALTQDSRITSVSDFSFQQIKNFVSVQFIVHTVFGDVYSEKVVNI